MNLTHDHMKEMICIFERHEFNSWSHERNDPKTAQKIGCSTKEANGERAKSSAKNKFKVEAGKLFFDVWYFYLMIYSQFVSVSTDLL